MAGFRRLLHGAWEPVPFKLMISLMATAGKLWGLGNAWKGDNSGRRVKHDFDVVWCKEMFC
jgi:hypothetical protein